MTLVNGEGGALTPTCVIGITLVLQLEYPGPVGVLVPEVCGHEGPVPVPLVTGVIRAGERRAEPGVTPAGWGEIKPMGAPEPPCPWHNGATPGRGRGPKGVLGRCPYRTVTSMDVVPMGLMRAIARSPLRL